MSLASMANINGEYVHVTLDTLHCSGLYLSQAYTMALLASSRDCLGVTVLTDWRLGISPVLRITWVQSLLLTFILKYKIERTE